MKLKDHFGFCLPLLVLLTLAAWPAAASAAHPPPLVYLLATDPDASETGPESGTFTVVRTGPVGQSLTVLYRVGGSAGNGLDYVTLSGTVTIPANRLHTPIHVTPFDDRLVEGNETVVLALEQPPIWPPPYVVCWPSVAVVTIEDNDPAPNQPPHVRLTNPPDGAIFVGPADIALVARAWDPDGRVRTVEFFADGRSLGIVPSRTLTGTTIPADNTALDLSQEGWPELFPDPDVDLAEDVSFELLPGNYFRLVWSNAPPGAHVLTALATDNRGATSTSAPIHIRVTDPPTQPIVNIFAVDPVAAEPNTAADRLNTALFQVRREGGDFSLPLPVFYRVGGTAGNGVDYEEIRETVVIPPGHPTAPILIKPLDDALVEGTESVTIQLLPPVCIAVYPPPPDCYRVGRYDHARAVILDNDPAPTNQPPAVRIVRPMDGDTFLAPADIRLVAEAKDIDGRVVTVEFFEGPNSLGIVTNDHTRLSSALPAFALTWSNVPPGHYILTAEATDDRGAQSWSPPVEIKVVKDTPNQEPTVAIVQPSPDQLFPASADIDIVVATRDPDGWVGLVEFFADNTKIGEDFIIFIRPPPPGQWQQFSMTWSNVPPGQYVLTAVATDNQGASAASEPVRIRVGEPCLLPVVTLHTPDPFAAEQDPRLDMPSDTATFRICRSCGTDADLAVLLEILGTASNGEDYALLSREVKIPAGAACVDVVVDPIDDELVEGIETVTLRLLAPDCLAIDPPPAGCYMVGSPSAGTAYIRDNDLPPNTPPKVAIINPPDGATFTAPVHIRIVADARDAEGWVRTVEFFANGESLGVVENHPWILDPIRPAEVQSIEPGSVILEPNPDPMPIPIHPFFLVWSNAPPGTHELTALATDNQGASSKSLPIHIKIYPPPPDPIVTVVARDPMASEGCPDPGIDCVDTATFVIHRTGDTTWPLRVFYRLAGTAVNGLDYLELPNSVVIPAGDDSVPVIVEPIDDNLAEGAESVVLALVEAPYLDLEPEAAILDPAQGPLPSYQVGRAHTARAVILDNDTPPNQPPSARLIQPEDGDTFRAPAEVKLVAVAFDPDGQIAQVEFFEGTNSLGVVETPTLEPAPLDATLDPAIRPLHRVYELTWTDVPPGRYLLTAVATDNNGAPGVSEPVEIKVVDIQLPPVVNIETTDPVATEQSPLLDSLPDTAAFAVSRTGPTDRSLTVFYRVSGTASNGVDYDLLAGRLIIPIGAASASLIVNPIDDLLCEGTESVRIRLVPHPCLTAFPPTRDHYIVGPQDRARAILRDDDICPPNQPPKVALLRPQDGDVFLAPAEILICAEAKDADGRVVRVDFFANSDLIGSVPAQSNTEPELFCLRWHAVPAGSYALTAVAVDDDGAQTRSEPVRIRVIIRPPLPIVHIQATDPVGSEDGDPAAFTITRNCCTNTPLTVRYRLGGTAQNGLDYEQLSGEATIPTGRFSTRLAIRPIDDRAVEGTETILARLVPSECAAVWPTPVDCYRIGYPSEDVVFLRDNDSAPNEPPLIGLLSPPQGALFTAPADIYLLAAGLDPDGWIPRVEFFAGTNKIGEVSVHFLVPPPPGQLQAFEYDWTEVPPGQYVLTAKATDNRGASTVSGPIHIRVLDPSQPPVVIIRAVDAVAWEGSPNTALFRIHRLGRTNEALTVQYAIGGTAENGVDYTTIPNSVSLAPGQRSASVRIEALKDNLKERLETVVLRLTLPTPVPPPYLIGRPDIAAAIIVDADMPRPPCHVLRDGLFHLCLPGQDGLSYRVEASHDLATWMEIASGVVCDGAIHFVDPEAPDHPQRFYRAVPEPISMQEE